LITSPAKGERSTNTNSQRREHRLMCLSSFSMLAMINPPPTPTMASAQLEVVSRLKPCSMTVRSIFLSIRKRKSPVGDAVSWGFIGATIPLAVRPKDADRLPHTAEKVISFRDKICCLRKGRDIFSQSVLWSRIRRINLGKFVLRCWGHRFSEAALYSVRLSTKSLEAASCLWHRRNRGIGQEKRTKSPYCFGSWLENTRSTLHRVATFG
jgi:hypothetical protein